MLGNDANLQPRCNAELNADVEVKRFPQLRFCMVDSPLFVKSVASTSTSAVTSLSSPRLLRVAMGADQFQVPGTAHAFLLFQLLT
jgi:hypothetical protein